MNITLFSILPLVLVPFDRILRHFCDRKRILSTIVIFEEEPEVSSPLSDEFMDFFNQHPCQLMNPRVLIDFNDDSENWMNSSLSLGGAIKNIFILRDFNSSERLSKYQDEPFFRNSVQTIFVIKEICESTALVLYHNMRLAKMKMLRAITLTLVEDDFRIFICDPYYGIYLVDITDERRIVGGMFYNKMEDLSDTMMATFKEINETIRMYDHEPNYYRMSLPSELIQMFRTQCRPDNTTHTLEEILEMRLDTIYMYENYYGIPAINSMELFPVRRQIVLDISESDILNEDLVYGLAVVCVFALILTGLRRVYFRNFHLVQEQRIRGQNGFPSILFETLGGCFGNTYYEPSKTMLSERIVLAMFYFFAIISVTLMSAMVYRDSINNSQNYDLISWDDLSNTVRDMWRQTLMGTFDPCEIFDCSYDQTKMDTAAVRTLMFYHPIVNEEILELANGTLATTSNQYKEDYFTFSTSKSSQMAEIVQKYVARLEANGLMDYFVKQQQSNVRRWMTVNYLHQIGAIDEGDNDKAITFGGFSNFLFFILIAWAICGLVFVGEVLHHRRVHGRRRRTGRRRRQIRKMEKIP